MSQKLAYEAKTEEFIAPILEELAFELVDVEYVKEGPDYYLRAYIDKPGGITIDDCVTVSRRMNEILDREDYISDAYIFEVSSPGLGRPLKKEKDFTRNLGKDVEIHTYKAIDGCKEFEGTLEAFDANSVTISIDESQLVFNRADISLIKQAVNFDDFE